MCTVVITECVCLDVSVIVVTSTCSHNKSILTISYNFHKKSMDLVDQSLAMLVEVLYGDRHIVSATYLPSKNVSYIQIVIAIPLCLCAFSVITKPTVTRWTLSLEL